VSSATRALIDKLSRVLGPPVCTPEYVMASDYRETHRLERARYRVFLWACPACLGGEGEPPYKPFVVDSDGRVWCKGPGCSAEELAATIRTLLAVAE
jgi:hypothetical protein